MQQIKKTTDGELVQQALTGRRSAYEELARRWAARVTAFCHAKTGSPDAAEDLAQESLLRGFRSLKDLRQPDRFGAWLRGIALRVCLDWLGRRRTDVTFTSLAANFRPDELASAGPDAALEAVDAAEETDRLLREVDSLPEEYREVLLLYYYDDVTYKDLADVLGVSTATINARLTKARALLRKRLSCSHRR